LQSLSFRDEFNQSLVGVELPSSLQSISFGFDFNQSLVDVKLPSSLQSLSFGHKYNQSLVDVKLPSSFYNRSLLVTSSISHWLVSSCLIITVAYMIIFRVDMAEYEKFQSIDLMNFFGRIHVFLDIPTACKNPFSMTSSVKKYLIE